MVGICLQIINLDVFFNSSKEVTMATKLGKILVQTFIRHSDIPKLIAISPCQFKNIQWQYFSYILCKFDKDQSSNPKDYKGKNCLDDMAEMGISHQISQKVPGPSPNFQC